MQAQVITKKGKELKDETLDWKKTKELSNQVKDLAVDLQETLDTLFTQMTKMNALIVEAYKECPKKETSYLASPFNSYKIGFQLKAYLFKKGLDLGGVRLFDKTKIKDFSDYVDEAVAWLLKFS